MSIKQQTLYFYPQKSYRDPALRVSCLREEAQVPSTAATAVFDCKSTKKKGKDKIIFGKIVNIRINQWKDKGINRLYVQYARNLSHLSLFTLKVL